MEAAAHPIPTLAVPSAWPACLRSAGRVAPALMPDDDALQLAKDLLYRLYGMFLAVLAARKTALDAAQQRAMFLYALLRWAGALLWLPGQGQVTYVELALDFEEHAGRALPAAPGHKLAGRVLPLGQRAHVLKLALDKTQQFLRAGELLGGQLRPLCNTLVPFGGYKCMGRTETPVFVCRQAMQDRMRRLEVHCKALWGRLARPGRGHREAFLNNYLPRPLGGQAPLRPFKRVRPQRPCCPLAQPPPPARPAGAPQALGRGLGTARILCPAHGTATCAACAATRQGIKYCCSLGHEGHRLVPAAQRAGARALRVWLQGPQQVHRPAPPPRTVLGSRGRESPRGSSEDEPPQDRQRVLSLVMLGRRHQPPQVGSSSDDDEPPPRAGSSFSHSSRDSSPHHPRGYGGRGECGRGVGQSQSQPRANSLSGSGLMSTGGGGCGHPRWLRSRPRHHPPPLLPWARPVAGAGGKDGGTRAWWTFLAPSRPRSLQRRGRMGHRATYLHPGIASSRGLQGGFELGRVQVPPHPSAGRGSRVLQGRACCVAGTGAARGCCSGSGVSRTGPGSRTGWSPSPPAAAQPPPPPLPPWAGRAGTGAR